MEPRHPTKPTDNKPKEEEKKSTTTIYHTLGAPIDTQKPELKQDVLEYAKILGQQSASYVKALATAATNEWGKKNMELADSLIVSPLFSPADAQKIREELNALIGKEYFKVAPSPRNPGYARVALHESIFKDLMKTFPLEKLQSLSKASQEDQKKLNNPEYQKIFKETQEKFYKSSSVLTQDFAKLSNNDKEKFIDNYRKQTPAIQALIVDLQSNSSLNQLKEKFHEYGMKKDQKFTLDEKKLMDYARLEIQSNPQQLPTLAHLKENFSAEIVQINPDSYKVVIVPIMESAENMQHGKKRELDISKKQLKSLAEVHWQKDREKNREPSTTKLTQELRNQAGEFAHKKASSLLSSTETKDTKQESSPPTRKM